MNYFNSNPWQDAANMGRGFGDTVVQGLLQLPQEKAQMRLQQQQLAVQQQEQPLRMQLLGSEVQRNQQMGDAEKARAEASQSQSAYNRARIEKLNTPSVVDPSIADALTTLSQGGQIPSEKVKDALQAVMKLPNGPKLLSDYFTSKIKAADQPLQTRVTRLGDVVLQGGQPVYTNNVQVARSPQPLPASDLMALTQAEGTNAAPMKAQALQLLQQRMGSEMGQKVAPPSLQTSASVSGAASSLPDSNVARQEALLLIQQHPDKAVAIKQRFETTYGQPLQ